MKLAIIGSRSIQNVDIAPYLSGVDEIVSGGAVGVDACAAAYAKQNGIPLTVFLPDYNRYGRVAPFVRNRQIVAYADAVLAFWDGGSHGTLSVIRYAKKIGKPCTVIAPDGTVL